ncbi:MAG: glycosyltransferase, partial [Paracoccus sp. (in: a-proteobacteria)]|nr:glycosyltransferase [Paracoccus sp. (in: a-proteobacteria)]
MTVLELIPSGRSYAIFPCAASFFSTFRICGDLARDIDIRVAARDTRPVSIAERDAMTAVSLIIPAFDAADFLDATLRSVSQQDLADFECLVVDDFSSDGTLSIAKGWR